MWEDEILDEIHKFREEHAKSFKLRFGCDVRRLAKKTSRKWKKNSQLTTKAKSNAVIFLKITFVIKKKFFFINLIKSNNPT
jgi:uncharacterized membrane protein YbaN (DUF454 family)